MQQQLFEGREPTLKGYVYDFTGERMLDQFIKTTKEIKNYVGRTYTKYTADLVQAVEDLDMHPGSSGSCRPRSGESARG
jgi:hypothetical protein